MGEPFSDLNARYETWLRRQCAVVEADLAHKHRRMADSPFLFLRCTFFAWASTIEAVLPALAAAPSAPSVGDSHVENFGSWRDAEGRLVWGVNDFDEGALIPWPYDLVRLLTSARLMPTRMLKGRRMAEAILEGYRDGLAAPGPFILDERWSWLAEAVRVSPAQREGFWRMIDALPAGLQPPRPPPTAAVKALLRASLPPDAKEPAFWPRTAGGGSLGRARFVAIAHWRGGRIVREAKALVPSAWDWAHGRSDAPSPWLALVDGGLEAPDPFMAVDGGFLMRRLAPYNRKIELGQGAATRLRLDGLRAMGQVLGTLHAAGGSKPILRDLDGRPANWLHSAAQAAEAAVRAEHEAWSAARPA